ncbi:hypothetical protein CEP54_003059 [Fusarium duplospermum]|uniref:Uncharacterized protein n=1 Tax=Fusarium duplospermum TaxID=1325734 RepID=A0A428QQY5_9HYPO|nr:hypothetical protein CEP54_003059 [Fusarium duplospermum]
MASKQTSKAPKKTYGTLEKLSSISNGDRIEKRPLTRRQPPASTKSRIIYVSSKTPFMSVVKRARKQLDASLRTANAAPKHASVHSRIEALKRAGGSDADSAEVKVMGTGRAVEKTLAVASWFEQEGDCEVEIRTGTVGTVDDVVVEGDEEDESRLRKLSYLEVSIKLK